MDHEYDSPAKKRKAAAGSPRLPARTRLHSADIHEAVTNLFGLQGKVAVVTGGYGVLGSVLVEGLATAGANVGVLGRNIEKANACVAQLRAKGLSAFALQGDVTKKEDMQRACKAVLSQHQKVDILVNAAGGNVADATIKPDESFFSAPKTAFEEVVDLNLLGTIIPTQCFGSAMKDLRQGTIINISSASANLPLSRVCGYSFSKAGVENLTRWLATEFLKEKYGARIRVNAIAPGFFLAKQNRALLMNENGTLTARGETIINNTPMKRFGDPQELVGALVWLSSDASQFVTGTVIPVDGGFTAFSGV
eukprot:g397.t1